VIVKPPLEVPAGLVAEQETEVVPSGKLDPEAGVQVTGTDPSSSDAVALNETAADETLSTFCVMLPGSASCGGPTIVTVKLPVETLPLPSSAEQFTVVWPRGKLAPDGGAHVTGTGVPPSAAVAV
jgi:hypothetical protein